MKDEKEPAREEGGKGTGAEVRKTQTWTRMKINVSVVRSRKERVDDRRSEEAGCVPRVMERHRKILRGRVTRSDLCLNPSPWLLGGGMGWRGARSGSRWTR